MFVIRRASPRLREWSMAFSDDHSPGQYGGIRVRPITVQHAKVVSVRDPGSTEVDST